MKFPIIYIIGIAVSQPLYTSWQMEAQQKPEGLKRLQVGVDTPACNLNAPSGLPVRTFPARAEIRSNESWTVERKAGRLNEKKERFACLE